MMCEHGVSRPFREERDRRRHHQFLPRLAEAGLAPRILHMDEVDRCLERCDSFSRWWPKATREQQMEMRDRVIRLIESIHGLGICHRDLHDHNLLLKNGQPVVIDLELACEVDPRAECYDLWGPSDAVPIAEQHVERGVHDGIWWDADVDPARGLVTLGQVFGPLRVPAGDAGAG